MIQAGGGIEFVVVIHKPQTKEQCPGSGVFGMMTGKYGLASQLGKSPVDGAAGRLLGIACMPVIGKQVDAQLEDVRSHAIGTQTAHADKGPAFPEKHRVILMAAALVLFDFLFQTLIDLLRGHDSIGCEKMGDLRISPQGVGQLGVLLIPQGKLQTGRSIQNIHKTKPVSLKREPFC